MRVERPRVRSAEVKVAIRGLKRGLEERGTRRTFVGAIAGGKERTARSSEPSRVQNTCSQREYLHIR